MIRDLGKLWDESYIDNSSVLRWSSNNRVPPTDVLEQFRNAGFEFDFETSVETRDRETAAFLAEYRANQAPPTAEQLYEMRAAFGEGVQVIDVLSGRRIDL